MARTVGIGHQDFGQLIRSGCFYIDKTQFIKEWWENNDIVTLITRPRRFGKTLNMSMVEHFFSVEHSGGGEFFERFSIWQAKTGKDGSPGGRSLRKRIISTGSCRGPIPSSACPLPR